MPKIAKELSALQVSRLLEAGHHAVGGVTGHYLYVTATGARSWVLRIEVGKKRKHMGLGGFPSVTLAMAREQARMARSEFRAGLDPIAARRKAVSKRLAEQLNAVTFESAAKAYIDGYTATEMAAGASLQINPRTSVYGELGKLWANGGDSRVKSGVQASIGVKVQW